MKITFFSFDCQMDVTTEKIALVTTGNLSELLSDLNIRPDAFQPHFVNLDFNEFIFCVDSIQWKNFVQHCLVLSETEILLHAVETPDGFDFDNNFYSSNPAIINYILHPLQRDYNFLMESSMRYSNEIVLSKLYEALESPKTYGVTSLKKFKKFWLKVNCYGQWAYFTTSRKRILSAIYRLFPNTYQKIYYKFFMNNQSISNSFRYDLISSSNETVLPF